MCFDRENNRQITEYPLYLHEDEKGNSEIIGRKGRKVRRLEMGGGMPEGGAPYQQLVTDGAGKTVWEDRLAYESQAAVSVLDKRTYSFTEVETNLYYVANMGNDYVLEANATYVVEWDGVEYECPVNDYGGDTGFWIGNNAIWGESPDTGEPFQIQYYIENGACYIYTSSTAPTHTVAIKTVKSVVKQIDPKFLPEGVGGGRHYDVLSRP